MDVTVGTGVSLLVLGALLLVLRVLLLVLGTLLIYCWYWERYCWYWGIAVGTGALLLVGLPRMLLFRLGAFLLALGVLLLVLGVLLLVLLLMSLLILEMLLLVRGRRVGGLLGGRWPSLLALTGEIKNTNTYWYTHRLDNRYPRSGTCSYHRTS